MNSINCLNPWDIQSKHIVTPDGISEALYAGECRWAGGEHYVLYEVKDGQCTLSESMGSAEQKTVHD